MSFYTTERLYSLLPAVYRQRDAEQGYPLRDLVALLAREAQVVEADIAGLYENWFVETCSEWAVPYLGDLIGVRPLAPTGESQRAEVAHTIGYRRRKGTAAVLEQLARDVTGWPAARVVEYFQLLSTTQFLNHLRPTNHRTPDLRRADPLEHLDGPFDRVAHTAEVRRAPPRRGRYNIPSVGLWLWRLEAYPLARVTAHPVAVPGKAGRCFTFSALGHDAPLFHLSLTETGPEHVAEEVNVPTPIRRRALHHRPEPFTGAAGSLRVFKDGTPVETAALGACNLEQWGRDPEAGTVGIDPVLGRLVFPEGEEPADALDGVQVTYAYGFPADLGGGPYPRSESFTQIDGEVVLTVGEGQAFASPDAALGGWIAAGRPSAVIEIHDSRTYRQTPTAAIPAGRRLEIRAAEGQRPTLLLAGDLNVTGGAGSAFEINGLVIAGGALHAGGNLDRLTLRHSTLVPGLGFGDDGLPTDPGAASLVVPGGQSEVLVEDSILGAVETADETEVRLVGSILDAGNPEAPAYGGAAGADFGGPVSISQCTVVGTVSTRQLTLGENTLFLGPVTAQRRQQGCVRFSFVPYGSRVPRRFRCQPELPEGVTAAQGELLTAQVRPIFTSLAYGHPAYCQLHWRGPEEILRGADDESEMGVYQPLRTPQREDNLRTRLDEYLPVGLEAGIFYVT
ncbi:MAG: phage tail protein [Acidobacteriota bacterium]|nr:phage tail protein [Acidobacteriota bacterium]